MLSGVQTMVLISRLKSLCKALLDPVKTFQEEWYRINSKKIEMNVISETIRTM